MILSLSSDQPLYLDQNLPIRVTLKNDTVETLYFCKYGTPWDSYETDCFSIKFKKEAVKFIGFMRAGRAYTPDAFVSLPPNEGISVVVILKSRYEIKSPGEYSITCKIEPFLFVNDVAGFLAGTVAENFALRKSLQALPTVFVVSPPSGTSESPQSVTSLATYASPIATNGATPSERQQTLLAHRDLWPMVWRGYAVASSYQGQTLHYTKWFGNYDVNRHATVVNVFSLISAAFQKAGFHYAFGSSECPGDAAFVYPGSHEINLCPPWDQLYQVSLHTKQSKPGVIFHELTHDYGNTADVRYESGGGANPNDPCIQLAISDPGSAVNNADSYRCFIESYRPSAPLAVLFRPDGYFHIIIIINDDLGDQRWRISPVDHNYATILTNVIDGKMALNKDGRMELVTVGKDNQLGHVWESAVGGTWSFGSFGLNRLIVAATIQANADGRLEAFYIDDSNQLSHVWQLTPGGGWSTEAHLDDGCNQIQAAINQDGRIEIFAIGVDGFVYNLWQLSPGGAWSGANLLVSMLVMDIKVITGSNGLLNGFFLSRNYQLFHFFQATPNPGWTVPVVLDNNVIDFEVIVDSRGFLDVFTIRSDHGVYHYRQAGVVGIWAQPFRVTHEVAALRAQMNGSGILHLFCCDVDGRVFITYQSAINSEEWSLPVIVNEALV